MPEILVDDPSSYPSSVTVPSGTDARTAASVKTPFQALANRAAWLKKLCELDGVRRIRSVGSQVDVSALDVADFNDRDVVIVNDDLIGLYVYRSASVAAADGVWVIPPSAGSGRWFHALYDLAGSANGLATLASDSRLEQVPARADHADAYVADVTQRTTSSAAFSDVTGASVSIAALQVGDVVDIDMDATQNPNGDSCVTRIALTENGGSVIPAGGTRTIAGANGAYTHTSLRRVVATAGTFVCKVQHANIDGATSVDTKVYALRVRVMRP